MSHAEAQRDFGDTLSVKRQGIDGVRQRICDRQYAIGEDLWRLN